ncbi:GGDEF domain-containing protein [Paenibacillus sp. S150]|uniref:GGDEF domain-containing protein n=1 Tax=Paenibacillus sp. S150 TaxID=2749826 RepID=UPI001C563E97|nr:GGDEF domain-containing protein [Paenibacillus sp. S150]MBW4082037.1 GGDEF domain-containing protein [Paenibacillus sp. S150]
MSLKITIKAALSKTMPFFLIAAAYFFYTKMKAMPNPQAEVINISAYVIFFVGAALSWKFNRSREFYILIILAIGISALTYGPEISGTALRKEDIYSIISLVIPLNIALFSFFKERGIISLWGGLRTALILAQGLLVYWQMESGTGEWLELLNKDWVPVNLHAAAPLPQLSVIAFIITLIILITRLFIYPASSQDISFIGVLLAIFYVLHHNSSLLPYSIFFAASGIVLIISIIQDSYSMAFSDELTGLPSRRALKQDMMKLGFNYVIAMLDIDHFKKFNDTYGHDTGDEVLKLVASSIRDVAGGGRAFRYGGEEFTILFPGKSVNDVLPHLEELRDRISKRPFTIRAKVRSKSSPQKRSLGSKTSKQVYITVSIGVSQKNEKYKTTDSVMKSADIALYRAKKKGRNRVSK